VDRIRRYAEEGYRAAREMLGAVAPRP